MIIKCKVADCTATIDIPNASSKTTFICRVHSGADVKNEDLRFQDHQFDKKFDSGSLPLGTSHIAHQGPRVLTSDQIYHIRNRDSAATREEENE